MLLNFAITPARLIDLAKDRSGLELQEMASEMGYDKTRITKLKNGKCALTPTEIKYYSSKAGLPFEETICELEMMKNPVAAKVWGVEPAMNPLLQRMIPWAFNSGPRTGRRAAYRGRNGFCRQSTAPRLTPNCRATAA